MKSPFLPFLVFLIMLSVNSCSGDTILNPPAHLTQGIEGTVLFWEGDFMPIEPSGTILPVVRTIHIYGPTKRSDVVWSDEPTIAKSISTQKIAKTQSNTDGIFRIELPAGRYSLFVEEEDGLYANGVDSNGYITPTISVTADSVSEITINVTYKATF